MGGLVLKRYNAMNVIIILEYEKHVLIFYHLSSYQSLPVIYALNLHLYCLLRFTTSYTIHPENNRLNCVNSINQDRFPSCVKTMLLCYLQCNLFFFYLLNT